MTDGLVPDEFDVVTVVFLRRGSSPPELDDEASDRLQTAHLEYGRRMRQEGHSVANGPLIQSSDETLRGITIYREDPETAKALAEQDPAVLAGRLEIVSAGWCTFPGLLDFPEEDRPVAERISREEMLRRW